MEASIIGACLNSREAYEYVQSYIEDGDFSERGRRILDEIASYYRRDESAGSADPGIILSRISRGLPSEKLGEQFRVALGSMAETELSPANVAYEFLELKRDNAGARLARSIQACKPREETEEALDTYSELMQATALSGAQRVELDIESLFAGQLEAAEKFEMLPGVLNKAIGGGVTRGDSIVVFGRPNAGKSTFCINAANGFVRRGLTVVFAENEDSDVRTTRRFVRRLIEKPQAWCEEFPAETAQLARERGLDRFHYYKLTPGTLGELDAICNRVRPDVLIVNQIRGIALAMPGSITPNMEKVAAGIRAIGQKYNVILIQVTQANAGKKDKDDNVIDKPVLRMEDIDSSLTGVPGAADFIFGIGYMEGWREAGKSCVTITKSKDEGDGKHFFLRVDKGIDKVYSK